MLLYKANGEPWDPYREETRVLDVLLRQIVDALRFRRPKLDNADPYGGAIANLTAAATEYSATLRSDPDAAGTVPHTHSWAS